MPAGAKFATGKYAYGICDICGVSCYYTELRGTTVRGRPTGLLSCPTCWDPDHPQNFLPEAITIDAEALRNSRPEDYGPSRLLPCVVPSGSLVARLSVGTTGVAA